MVFRANMRRLIYIVTVIIRHAAAQSVHMLLTRWPRLAFSARFARISGPERLRLFFEELGGTFIKFGQMLALQPGVLQRIVRSTRSLYPFQLCGARANLHRGNGKDTV